MHMNEWHRDASTLSIKRVSCRTWVAFASVAKSPTKLHVRGPTMVSFQPTSLLFIPPGLAGISLVYLGLRFRFSCLPHSLVVDGKAPAGSTGHRNRDGVLSTRSSPKRFSTFSETIQEFDGASIISFRTLRFLAIVALLALQIFDVASENANLTNYFQLVFLVSWLRPIQSAITNVWLWCRLTHPSFLFTPFVRANRNGGIYRLVI